MSKAHWWPCWEEDFSDIVAAFLRQDIGGHRVVINREVQVRRSGFPGLRTDIQIEAPAPRERGDDTINVVMRCKGCWNPSLPTALANQLVNNYLRSPRSAGIFLLGYFDCDRWDTNLRRGCPATGHTPTAILAYQQQQADKAREQDGVLVSPFVLDCRLPGSSEEWRTPETAPPDQHSPEQSQY